MSGNGKRGKVLVVGGGISGLTAAIEASEAGCEVVLVERRHDVRLVRFERLQDVTHLIESVVAQVRLGTVDRPADPYPRPPAA